MPLLFNHVHDKSLNQRNVFFLQKDHVKVSLDDLMASYSPPVKIHRYKLRFIPVIPQHSTPEEIEAITTYNSR